MITYEDYVGKFDSCVDLTGKIQENIINRLIPIVQDLCSYMKDRGVTFHINPKTDSYISGEIYGGFRP